MTSVMYRGANKGFTNEAAPIVAEYAARKRLADIGYTTDFDELDSIKADCFLLISGEIDRLDREKSKTRRRR